MACDERLAERVRQGLEPPTLRVYAWRCPAVTLGRRQQAREVTDSRDVAGLPLVHRPTAGGAVLHMLDELTYAAAFPRAIVPARIRFSDVPGAVHASFRDRLAQEETAVGPYLDLVRENFSGPRSFCFSAPVRGDLLYRGRKVAGAALRVWRDGFLIQGSVQGLPVHRPVLERTLFEALAVTLPLRR